MSSNGRDTGVHQVWEFCPESGTPEELSKVEMAHQSFRDNHFHKKHSSDLLMRIQVNLAIRVEIPDIVFVSSCADLTLSPDAGLCIDTTYGPIFLIADSWESLNGWLDAIRLVYTIYARGKIDVLASIITS
ncbi:hypothetical protein GOBAR_DD18186 [Gossypium barbadense]|nr:hypothetical protein GOBAR_DD18186 [Gossypium barbadense]